jgi:hypothetical protein
MDGRLIEVISPGWWNLEKGPDFFRAEIQVDNEIILKGDIEIDISSQDWKSHGHHQDPAFNGVILHVVWQKGLKDKKIFNSLGQEIMELELGRFLSSDIFKLLDKIDPEAYPYYCQSGQGSCSSILQKKDLQEIGYILDRIGDERIVLKALRYEKELLKEGMDELAYQGIMRALGYKNNQLPFIKLAKHLKLSVLTNILTHSSSITDCAFKLETVFLITSGLITYPIPLGFINTCDNDTRLYLESIERAWREIEDLIPPIDQKEFNWKLLGSRPANYPPRRLAGIAYFLAENLTKGIFTPFLSILKGLAQTSIKPTKINQYSYIFQALLRCLNPQSNDYWLTHYTLGGKGLARPIKLIGPEKINHIIINVAIPLTLLYARQKQNQELEKALYHIYQITPKTPPNSITRLMTNRILGTDRERWALINSGRRQQSLLQLFADYCSGSRGNCEGCKFLSDIKAR